MRGLRRHRDGHRGEGMTVDEHTNDDRVTGVPPGRIPRIAIVGAGNIASLNVAGYLDDPRCDVVAVCDPKEDRAAAAAAAWGVPAAYTDLDAMLADAEIDAVE